MTLHEIVLAKIEALQGSMVNLSMKLDRVLAHQHAAATPPPAAHKPARRVAKKKRHKAAD